MGGEVWGAGAEALGGYSAPSRRVTAGGGEPGLPSLSTAGCSRDRSSGSSHMSPTSSWGPSEWLPQLQLPPAWPARGAGAQDGGHGSILLLTLFHPPGRVSIVPQEPPHRTPELPPRLQDRHRGLHPTPANTQELLWQNGGGDRDPAAQSRGRAGGQGVSRVPAASAGELGHVCDEGLRPQGGMCQPGGTCWARLTHLEKILGSPRRVCPRQPQAGASPSA